MMGVPGLLQEGKRCVVVGMASRFLGRAVRGRGGRGASDALREQCWMR